MWGFTGENWQYIGNQIVLQQAMTQEQCEYLLADGMWHAFYSNDFYKMSIQCAPES